MKKEIDDMFEFKRRKWKQENDAMNTNGIIVGGVQCRRFLANTLTKQLPQERGKKAFEHFVNYKPNVFMLVINRSV